MTNKPEMAVHYLQPFYGLPYLEVFDPDTVEPDFWSAKLVEMATYDEQRAATMRVRKGSPRAREKERLQESAALLRSASESIEGRLSVDARGKLTVKLGVL